MQFINYKRLTEITKTVKPYRGSTNRFPISYRTQNHKCFYVEKEGDDTIYRITYGFSGKEFPVTKEEYINAGVQGVTNYHEISWRDDTDPMKYVRYETHPREIGIVRPDNSFEFTASYYGQGDNTIMSGWCNGYFFRSSRHGGMVFTASRDGVFHPIYKGMRLDCDTMQALTPYQVTGQRVMRKVAKDFLKQYVDFYKISDAMMKSMRSEDFIDMTYELLEDLGAVRDGGGWGVSIDTSNLHNEAQNRLSTSPLDSAMLYCVAHDVMNVRRRVSYHKSSNNYYGGHPLELESVYDAMRRKLNKEIFRNNPSVMKPIEYEMGKRYPASDWGVTITVDGKEVEQY